MFTEALRRDAAQLLEICRSKGLRLAAAESCTGGLVAALLTEIPGSSDVFDRGFITYSNSAKTELLGVEARLIAAHGAVSEQVGAAMAQGAVQHARVDIAVSVTGVAGPGGGTAEKPVGLVYIAVATRDMVTVEKHHFSGDRAAIRLAGVAGAMEMLKANLIPSPKGRGGD